MRTGVQQNTAYGHTASKEWLWLCVCVWGGETNKQKKPLTYFFDTVIDKLLLFFLIGDRFCLQMTRLEGKWK